MVGKALQKARLDAGLSQETVAAKADLNRSYLSQVERDVKSPTVKVLFRICNAIGVSAASIIAQAEPKRRQRPSK